VTYRVLIRAVPRNSSIVRRGITNYRFVKETLQATVDLSVLPTINKETRIIGSICILIELHADVENKKRTVSR